MTLMIYVPKHRFFKSYYIVCIYCTQKLLYLWFLGHCNKWELIMYYLTFFQLDPSWIMKPNDYGDALTTY